MPYLQNTFHGINKHNILHLYFTTFFVRFLLIRLENLSNLLDLLHHVVMFQELFEGYYFCQRAKPYKGHPTILR